MRAIFILVVFLPFLLVRPAIAAPKLLCDNDARCVQVTPEPVHPLIAVHKYMRRHGWDIQSLKTGATARVAKRLAKRFQAYINDLEAHGARILFMGGYRKGKCGPRHEHSCGRALDVCQLRRDKVDQRCHLPPRNVMASIAARHGLFEGGQWCHGDYGHAQADVTAPACSDARVLAARRRISTRAVVAQQ